MINCSWFWILDLCRNWELSQELRLTRKCQLTFKGLTVCESIYIHMPTLQDYPEVSGTSRYPINLLLSWQVLNLPDKINFWAFLCFSMEFSPKLTHSMVSGVFLCNILSMTNIIWSLQSKEWILVGSNNHVRGNILS